MAELSNIRLIIWDLDGALVNTMPDIVNSLRASARAVGYGELTPEQTSNKVGGGAYRAFEAIFGADSEFVQPAVDYFRGYYAEHCADESTLYPGVREVLDHFAGQVHYAMATAKIRTATLRLLEKLQVRDHFGLIVSADDMERMKPDPQSIEMILDHYREVRPDQAVIIGDMATDILAGRAAGVHTIAASYGYGKAADLEQAGADLIVASPKDLLTAISCA